MPVDVISGRERESSSDSVSIRDYVEMRVYSIKSEITAEIKRLDQVQDLQIDAVKEATRIASTALDRRLEGMNEFREQMNDWATRFITRAESEAAKEAMGDRVSALEKVSNNLQGRLWAVAAIVVVIELALRFIGH
jgi:hypothetical protein